MNGQDSSRPVLPDEVTALAPDEYVWFIEVAWHDGIDNQMEESSQFVLWVDFTIGGPNIYMAYVQYSTIVQSSKNLCDISLVSGSQIVAFRLERV